MTTFVSKNCKAPEAAARFLTVLTTQEGMKSYLKSGESWWPLRNDDWYYCQLSDEDEKMNEMCIRDRYHDDPEPVLTGRYLFSDGKVPYDQPDLGTVLTDSGNRYGQHDVLLYFIHCFHTKGS